MEYAHLGRIGLKVSRLALGTMNFGELTDEATSFAILDDALVARMRPPLWSGTPWSSTAAKRFSRPAAGGASSPETFTTK